MHSVARALERTCVHSTILKIRPCVRSRIAEKNWNMRLPGVADAQELKAIKKTSVTDAHRARVQDVRKSKSLSNR